MLDLRKATLLALTGLCVNFVLRGASTVVPALTVDIVWARLAVVFILLGGLAQVFFFVAFRSGYVRPEQQRLHQAANWAIVGTAMGVLPALEHLMYLFHFYPVESLVWSHTLEAVAPLLSSIALFAFFIVLRRELPVPGTGGAGDRLRSAAAMAAVGTAVFMLVNLAVLVNFLFADQSLSLPHRLLGMVVLPFLTLAFLALVYFFGTFYRGLKHAAKPT
jgi:hypothetical protein